MTANDQYYIEVNFDYSGFDDGNGFNRAVGIQIDRLEPELVGDEDGEINAYLDRYEIDKINDALEDSIAVKLQKLGRGSHAVNLLEIKHSPKGQRNVAASTGL